MRIARIHKMIWTKKIKKVADEIAVNRSRRQEILDSIILLTA